MSVGFKKFLLLRVRKIFLQSDLMIVNLSNYCNKSNLLLRFALTVCFWENYRFLFAITIKLCYLQRKPLDAHFLTHFIELKHIT